MRVLIAGAAGQVGQELLRLAPERADIVAMDRTSLDIADASQVAAVIARVKPELIFNAAAYTAVDKAESERNLVWAVNCDGVANLATAAQQAGIPLLHISTDYVFDGTGQQPYSETSATGPTGVYGASKLAGEQALVRQCTRHIILRTSWVFGAQGNNFVKTMLRLGGGRDKLGVVADQRGCPTSAASIADTLWSLAKQFETQGTLKWGTYHFSNAPACSWHEFAVAIFDQGLGADLLDRVPAVDAIATRDYPTPACRPAWSVLDCSKLKAAYGITQPDWRNELGKMLAQLKSGQAEARLASAQRVVVKDLDEAFQANSQDTLAKASKF
ncbi:dTDP-4-dehydrorhamnose reductase [Stutzerimonas xanthomarina]|uniref:dTDP-4-dehydrorhamnose reductase n=1 Tax=Stutzerimonas xanthomarina TaxID=271420 RepID=UPI003AA9D06F